MIEGGNPKADAVGSEVYSGTTHPGNAICWDDHIMWRPRDDGRCYDADKPGSYRSADYDGQYIEITGNKFEQTTFAFGDPQCGKKVYKSADEVGPFPNWTFT